MIRSVTRSITKQILNEDTGEIEPFKFVEDSRFKNSFKKGWRMYYTDYDDMLEKVIRSSKDVAMLHYLKEKINRDFELNINITKESARMKVGRNKLSTFLSRLVDANFLCRTDVGFKSNPFMYIPYMANNIKEKQEEWKYDSKI